MLGDISRLLSHREKEIIGEKINLHIPMTIWDSSTFPTWISFVDLLFTSARFTSFVHRFIGNYYNPSFFTTINAGTPLVKMCRLFISYFSSSSSFSQDWHKNIVPSLQSIVKEVQYP